VGGVPLEEMNILEMEFLESMGYRVHIFPKEFHEYSDAVNEKVDLLRPEGEVEVPSSLSLLSLSLSPSHSNIQCRIIAMRALPT
jgi:hypothetical protein